MNKSALGAPLDQFSVPSSRFPVPSWGGAVALSLFRLVTVKAFDTGLGECRGKRKRVREVIRTLFCSISLLYQLLPGHTDRILDFIFLFYSATYRKNREIGGLTGNAKFEG